jgi:ankyrin repeat protein
LQSGLDVNFSKPLSGADESMNTYLDWIESATNISLDSSFTLDNSYSYGGETLLHVAVKKGHLSLVKLLIENGASINIADESGNTALHYAAANGKKDIVKLLLENHADPSVVNVKEQKAIDYSNIKGYNEITEALLKYSPKDIAVAPVPTVQTAASNGAAPENPMALKKQALLDLKELLDAGILSQEEFDTEKQKILKG